MKNDRFLPNGKTATMTSHSREIFGFPRSSSTETKCRRAAGCEGLSHIVKLQPRYSSNSTDRVIGADGVSARFIKAIIIPHICWQFFGCQIRGCCSTTPPEEHDQKNREKAQICNRFVLLQHVSWIFESTT